VKGGKGKIKMGCCSRGGRKEGSAAARGRETHKRKRVDPEAKVIQGKKDLGKRARWGRNRQRKGRKDKYQQQFSVLRGPTTANHGRRILGAKERKKKANQTTTKEKEEEQLKIIQGERTRENTKCLNNRTDGKDV